MIRRNQRTPICSGTRPPIDIYTELISLVYQCIVLCIGWSVVYLIVSLLLRFEPWDHFKHEEAKKKLYTQKVMTSGRVNAMARCPVSSVT